MLQDAPYKADAMRNGMPESKSPVTCGHDVFEGELIVQWDNGETLCPDCFEEKINEWLSADPGSLADALGLYKVIMEV